MKRFSLVVMLMLALSVNSFAWSGEAINNGGVFNFNLGIVQELKNTVEVEISFMVYKLDGHGSDFQYSIGYVPYAFTSAYTPDKSWIHLQPKYIVANYDPNNNFIHWSGVVSVPRNLGYVMVVVDAYVTQPDFPGIEWVPYTLHTAIGSTIWTGDIR